MNLKSIIAISFFVFGISNVANAQFGFSHEIGAIVGPVAFQSDYGERHNLNTNAGNTGFGVGLIHYLNFSYKADCNCYNPETYFNDHFKLRSELSFSKTELDHFGQWVEGNNSIGKRQLRAMHGSTSVTNVGMQLEFFPWSIREFTATEDSWAPFISFGGQFSFYDPNVSSSMGTMGTPLTTFYKYLPPSDGKPNGFSSEGGTVWSLVSSVGTRYKLTEMSDLMIDVRLQYYFSDWVDGINQNKDLFKENKANDWLVWLNFGYIYYL